jgi:transposase
MRFYTHQHPYYCGIDLHARSLYVCILAQDGEIMLHRKIPARPDRLLRLVQPYRQGLVIGVECMFAWYWVADLCADEGIDFVLGHALYMKAIHGGKAKNDRIDSQKIAVLLRGGMFPIAYVYPRQMRATRDLLRRRNFLVQRRSALLAHIETTNAQYNLDPFTHKLTQWKNRRGVPDRFPDPSVRVMIEMDVDLIDVYDQIVREIELHVTRHAKGHDNQAYHRLRTIPGVGEVLSLVLLYEIQDIARFERVQHFVSYCRLVKCAHESAGKRTGSGGAKIGNAHLKWAFSQAACLLLRGNQRAQAWMEAKTAKYGKGKALTLLAKKLATAVYFMLQRQQAFDMNRFFTT